MSGWNEAAVDAASIGGAPSRDISAHARTMLCGRELVHGSLERPVEDDNQCTAPNCTCGRVESLQLAAIAIDNVHVQWTIVYTVASSY